MAYIPDSKKTRQTILAERRQKYKDRHKYLMNLQDKVRADWKDIKSFILPKRGRFTDMDELPDQASQMSNIKDHIGGKAHNVMASGMYQGLTSPARPWFRLTLEDKELANWGPARLWLDIAEQAMYTAYRKSNFYTEANNYFAELGGFGTGALYEEEDPETYIRFTTFTAGEYVCSANARGMIDVLYRLFWMTPAQMEEKFGYEALTQQIKTAIRNKQKDKFFKVLHLCQPRTDRNNKKIDAKNKVYESVYMDFVNQQSSDLGILRESGYDEFPIFVSRWEKAGSDVYGQGPGHMALPDVKQIQEMEISGLKAIHKTLDPPMMIPTGFMGRLNLLPGGENYYNETEFAPLKPLYQINFDIQSAEAKLQAKKVQVQQAFFNDLFLMITNNPYGQPPTATEIAERHEEKLLVLGPVIERQQDEFLDPLNNRTFNILYRQQIIPPAPPDLQGQELKLEYIGVLAQAQRLVAMEGINSAVNFALLTSELNPEILDKIDFDAALDEVSDATGTPAKIIRTELEVRRIREQRAKAQQAEALNQQMAEGAEAFSKLGKVQTGEGKNLAGDIVEQMRSG